MSHVRTHTYVLGPPHIHALSDSLLSGIAHTKPLVIEFAGNQAHVWVDPLTLRPARAQSLRLRQSCSGPLIFRLDTKQSLVLGHHHIHIHCLYSDPRAFRFTHARSCPFRNTSIRTCARSPSYSDRLIILFGNWPSVLRPTDSQIRPWSARSE